jgi:Fe-S cluster biosynthesis and repair protein YggX
MGCSPGKLTKDGLRAEPAAPTKGVLGNATALWQARTAMLLTEAQLKRLQLEERRGLVVNRQTALAKAFAFARLFRDAWQAWPAHVGPLLAAHFELDPTAVTVALEDYVREHLERLARERFEL